VSSHEHPWFWRALAPVAFFVAATVLILLVQSALSSDEGSGASPTTQPTTGPTTTPGGTTGVETTTTGEEPRRRFYRVKQGDLLETIAAEFNTSVEQLIELNPGIDPQALTVGQRIRVR
jgi:LysM repeat protein